MHGYIFMFRFDPIFPKRVNEIVRCLNEYLRQYKIDSIVA